MDECIWNHTHLRRGFLEDHKLLQEMYEIILGLCDPLMALASSCLRFFVETEILYSGDVSRKSN